MQPFLLNMLVNRLAFSAFELRPDEQIVNSEITRNIVVMLFCHSQELMTVMYFKDWHAVYLLIHF